MSRAIQYDQMKSTVANSGRTTPSTVHLGDHDLHVSTAQRKTEALVHANTPELDTLVIELYNRIPAMRPSSTRIRRLK